MNQIQIKMDLFVAHKIIQQIEKRDKKKITEHKDTIERLYTKSCEYCGQNLFWRVCKNNILKNK